MKLIVTYAIGATMAHILLYSLFPLSPNGLDAYMFIIWKKYVWFG
jgi:hypothetical protein